jgi:spore coat protein CotH
MHASSLRSRRCVIRSSLVSGLALATWRVDSASVRAQGTGVTSTDQVVFLDPAGLHQIDVAFDQSAYDSMIQVFIDTDEKEWIEGTVTVNGQSFSRAGLRLKGNSSLAGLRAEGTDLSRKSAVSAEVPESLPWLIDLERNIDGQALDGLSEIVIRSNMTATALNEALSLRLLSEAGLPSQRAAYVSLTVNGSEPRLRLSIEHPKDDWMRVHFGDGGLLYKSEAGGDWSYRGDDPAAYKGVFDLEAGDHGSDEANFAPLTAFLAYLNDSDDATFRSDLDNRLDTDRFLTYLAMMDLIRNGDDIDGPGNNSYLHSAPDTGFMTVVPWDMNLSFDMLGGPDLATGDHRGNGDAMPPPNVSGTPEVIVFDGDAAPGFDQAATPAAGGVPGDGQFIRNGPANILVTRFTAIEGIADQLAERTSNLHGTLFESGVAATILQDWVSVLTTHGTNLVDQATIDGEAGTLAEIIAGNA